MALILALPLCPLPLWTVCPLQMYIKWIVESESKGINELFCIKLTSLTYLEFFFLGFTIANNLLTVNLILCIIFLSHLWTYSAPSLRLWIFSLVFLQVSFLAILTSASSLHPPTPLYMSKHLTQFGFSCFIFSRSTMSMYSFLSIIVTPKNILNSRTSYIPPFPQSAFAKNAW